jgi:hypothetical protein
MPAKLVVVAIFFFSRWFSWYRGWLGRQCCNNNVTPVEANHVAAYARANRCNLGGPLSVVWIFNEELCGCYLGLHFAIVDAGRLNYLVDDAVYLLASRRGQARGDDCPDAEGHRCCGQG